jgi:hypothetical protein
VVTNGMSQYSRNERNANAAIVVGITRPTIRADPLAGIACSALGSRAFRGSAAAITRPRRNWSAISLPAGASTGSAR